LTQPYRYFIKLAYHGAAYHGWQIQANGITVQEILDHALSRILKAELKTLGCGRTDTGVHARCFFAHFDSMVALADTDALVYQLNAILPADIVVFDVLPVIANAHARFSAFSRTYRYYLHFGKNPFLSGQSWRMVYDLNIPLMQQALALLPGERDFSCFARSNADHDHGICSLTEASLHTDQKQLVFCFTANRFLRNMVRAMVGTLVLVGREKISITGVSDILDSGNRSLAGDSAPAMGLFLENVQYHDNIWLRN
jgi:tRNA pseudouridine38-40 synthase